MIEAIARSRFFSPIISFIDQRRHPRPETKSTIAYQLFDAYTGNPYEGNSTRPQRLFCKISGEPSSKSIADFDAKIASGEFKLNENGTFLLCSVKSRLWGGIHLDSGMYVFDLDVPSETIFAEFTLLGRIAAKNAGFSQWNDPSGTERIESLKHRIW